MRQSQCPERRRNVIDIKPAEIVPKSLNNQGVRGVESDAAGMNRTPPEHKPRLKKVHLPAWTETNISHAGKPLFSCSHRGAGMKPTRTVLGNTPLWPVPQGRDFPAHEPAVPELLRQARAALVVASGRPWAKNFPRQEARMEMLHALRFWTKLHRMDPAITPEGWSEIYAQLQVNAHWRCGCPNQRLDPDWERLRAWLRKQMGDLGEDHLQET